MPVTLYPHGTWERYNQGCRGLECQGACTRAHTRLRKRQRHSRLIGKAQPHDHVDPTYVIATLKKWRANEWTPDQIAKITGMHADHVRRLTRPDRRPRFVYRHTDAAVREVDAIGIYTAFRVRDREAKAQERIAVLRLLINGMSQKGVAEQMGISPRIISRYVSEARLINLSRRAWWHRLHELETAINRYLSGKCTAYEAVSSVGMMATRFWGVSKVDRRVLTRKAVA